MNIYGEPDERDWGFDPQPFWPYLLGAFIACLVITIIDWLVK